MAAAEGYLRELEGRGGKKMRGGGTGFSERKREVDTNN